MITLKNRLTNLLALKRVPANSVEGIVDDSTVSRVAADRDNKTEDAPVQPLQASNDHDVGLDWFEAIHGDAYFIEGADSRRSR